MADNRSPFQLFHSILYTFLAPDAIGGTHEVFFAKRNIFIHNDAAEG